MSHIIVNGAFYRLRLTGVPRYARSMTERLIKHPNVLLAVDEAAAPEIDTAGILRVPRGRLTRLAGRRLNSKAWYQFDLKPAARGNVLWSPHGYGPLGVRHHVATIHDIAMVEHPEWFRSYIAAAGHSFLRRLTSEASLIFTDSEYSRTRLMERFGLAADRVSVILCAADERFEPASLEAQARLRERYKLPERYILSLCTIEPRKNLINLFRAWRRLPKATRDCCALVVAGGRDNVFARQDYRELLHDMPDVIFTGHFPDADLPALYSGALALAYPSLYEGFGLPPLEAMACGTPVITCNNTSLPEVVGDAALFVEPLEPESIASAIEALAEQPELRLSLSQRGLQRARRFSWDRSAADAYRQLNEIASTI